MMRLLRLFVVLPVLATWIAAPAHAAKDPVYLDPSSSWHVDYQEDSCRLMRVFGEGDESVHLVIDKFAPGKTMHMVLAGKGLDLRYLHSSLARGRAYFRNSRPEKIEIQFGQFEEAQKRSFSSGDFGNRPALILSVGDFDESVKRFDWNEQREKEADPSKFLPLSPERADAMHYIRLGKPLSQDVYLNTGSLKAPFAALDQCIDELLTHWGIDAERHRTLSRAAAPANSPTKWMNGNDYPNAELYRGIQGLVHFRMSINEKGDVTACHIQKSTRPAEFDVIVCKALTKRAKFEPALDQAGQPIASFWRSSVRFEIP